MAVVCKQPAHRNFHQRWQQHETGLRNYFPQGAAVASSGTTYSSSNNSAVLANGVGFIAFSSYLTNVRKGFRLRIEATPATVSGNESTFFVDEANGTFKYPEQGLCRLNDRVLNVLQLTTSNYLKISYLETEPGYDALHVFAIPPYDRNNNVTYQGGWTGSYPCGLVSSLTNSAYPRVVLFASDASTQSYGFELERGVNPAPQKVMHDQTKKLPFKSPIMESA